VLARRQVRRFSGARLDGDFNELATSSEAATPSDLRTERGLSTSKAWRSTSVAVSPNGDDLDQRCELLEREELSSRRLATGLLAGRAAVRCRATDCEHEAPESQPHYEDRPLGRRGGDLMTKVCVLEDAASAERGKKKRRGSASNIVAFRGVCQPPRPSFSQWVFANLRSGPIGCGKCLERRRVRAKRRPSEPHGERSLSRPLKGSERSGHGS
jgi:hypothetical protein